MAFDTALVFTWGIPIAGRESRALEVFADGLAFFGRLAAEGKCLEPEVLQRTGGGMTIVRGERDELLGILYSEEGMELLSRTALAVEDFTWQLYAAGELVTEIMQRYQKVGTELGYF